GTEAADTAATGGTAASSAFEGPVSRGVLGGILGLFAGFGLALLAERLDRRIRTRQAAEEAFRLPVLAEVPKLDSKEQGAFGIAAHDAPMSAAAEAFRAIRSALLFQHAVGTAATSANGDGGSGARVAPSFEAEPTGPIIVMVASASPREGKTTTAANLAAVFAETGSSVLVVNCDFRRPMIHRYLGVQDIPRRVIATRIPGVKAVTNVLDDPDANPARVLAEQRRLINAARGQFDVMILDTAPLLSANDAIELVGGADLVLMVARADQSTIHEAGLSIEMLERVHAPIAGLVLMGTTDSPNSYYNSYRAEPPKTGKAAKPKAERRRGKDRRAAAAAVSTNGAGSGDAATSVPPAADPHA
ncbi:MAG TPA: hypothetical protein VFZ17_00975, partial [Acidimicrobiia bacterium]|nr:hypothetical protein [Acidimicrobiia bacterium]